MAEPDKKSQLQTLRTFQQKTGLSLVLCKQVLTETQYDVDNAICLLRNKGLIPDNVKQEIAAHCRTLSYQWAEDFLALTKETGELSTYHAKGKVGTIQDNYYSWYVIGHIETDFHLLFKDKLRWLTSAELDELEIEAKRLYDEAVSHLISGYLK